MSEQWKNVDNCLLNSVTHLDLSKHNLLCLTFIYIKKLVTYFLENLQACANELYHEFVSYMRKLDYKEDNISIPSVIYSIFFLDVFDLNEKNYV